jgi:hypothetical protein
MYLTEQIIDTVDHARKNDLADDELDRLLSSIGCTRVVHFADILIVYYVAEHQEQFLVIDPL